jgi:hypothetical protein
LPALSPRSRMCPHCQSNSPSTGVLVPRKPVALVQLAFRVHLLGVRIRDLMESGDPAAAAGSRQKIRSATASALRRSLRWASSSWKALSTAGWHDHVLVLDRPVGGRTPSRKLPMVLVGHECFPARGQVARTGSLPGQPAARINTMIGSQKSSLALASPRASASDEPIGRCSRPWRSGACVCSTLKDRFRSSG